MDVAKTVCVKVFLNSGAAKSQKNIFLNILPLSFFILFPIYSNLFRSLCLHDATMSSDKATLPLRMQTSSKSLDEVTNIPQLLLILFLRLGQVDPLYHITRILL